ncbi:unnamed protein product [Microthlaspi erraticum]|uniref:F-box domain-containing protein n=1 Tax=Microthlaspi erraticum TaxID=1685480 RepID=A0A6D2IMD2_9BRAS|nr:unnamed protein product [Microthlaspi erraticum]CAA7041602.1 unnamed protein product [Microthlaspi erraticum]
MMNMEEMKKSLESPPPVSFLSLPHDIVDNCLARIPRILRPALSLVSRSFRSIIASPELEVTRLRMGIVDDCLYVCLEMGDENNPNPRWFTLAPIPKRQKLLPILDSFPYQHPETSTIVSMGSKMYLIGGLVDEERSRRVLFLDCRSHQWFSLPDMIVPRDRPAAEVIDGKIYVIGGCSKDKNVEHWGEVYDPQTLTWEPFSPATLDLTNQKSVVQGRLVMGGRVYETNGLKLSLKREICLVETETNVWCEIYLCSGELRWRDAYVDLTWRSVEGLEKLSPYSFLVTVANSGGRRVTVWWKHCRYVEKWVTDIWCAEISFKRQGVRGLRGCVEWTKSVLRFDGRDCPKKFVLHSALVTH